MSIKEQKNWYVFRLQSMSTVDTNEKIYHELQDEADKVSYIVIIHDEIMIVRINVDDIFTEITKERKCIGYPSCI